MIREMATEVLEFAGFRVVSAGDAAEALAILEREPAIDILFTDVRMPGKLDGLALARIAHRRWPWIRPIVTSGHVRISHADVPDHGRFLPKPYSLDDLVNVVDEMRPRQ